MAGNRPIQCLLCDKAVVVRGIDTHVQKHLKYFPLKCGSCDFQAINKADFEQHLFDDDHQSAAVVEPYKEWLVRTLHDDIVKAARYGVETLLRSKPEPSFAHPPTAVAPISSTPRRENEEESSSGEIEETTPPPRKKLKQKKKEKKEEEKQQQQRTDKKASVATVPRSQSKTVAASDPEADKDIEALKRKNKQIVSCLKCDEPINFMLHIRQAHVSENHMKNVDKSNRKKYRLILERETNLCFAGLVSKRTECAACGDAIDSDNGRLSHVTKHFHYEFVACPLGCGFSTKLHCGIHGHLRKEHGLEGGRLDPAIAGEQYADFHSGWEKYRDKIRYMIRLLFPIPLPPSKKGKAKGAGSDEDDEDCEEGVDWTDQFAELYNNPPTRTPVPTPKRNRPIPSPYVSSDSDDEMNETTKKMRANIVKNNKEGDEKRENEDSSDSSDIEILDYRSSGSSSRAAPTPGPASSQKPKSKILEPVVRTTAAVMNGPETPRPGAKTTPAFYGGEKRETRPLESARFRCPKATRASSLSRRKQKRLQRDERG